MTTQKQGRIQAREKSFTQVNPSSQLASEPPAKDFDICLSPKVLPVEYLIPQLGCSSKKHTHTLLVPFQRFSGLPEHEGEVNSTHRLPSHCKQRGSDSQSTTAECGQSPAAKPGPIACCSPARSGIILSRVSPQTL